jgi:hypothetical protein
LFYKLLNLEVHLFFFVLIEIDTIDTVLDDELVPVVVFDDFNYFLLLVGSDNGKDLTYNNFD